MEYQYKFLTKLIKVLTNHRELLYLIFYWVIIMIGAIYLPEEFNFPSPWMFQFGIILVIVQIFTHLIISWFDDK